VNLVNLVNLELLAHLGDLQVPINLELLWYRLLQYLHRYLEVLSHLVNLGLLALLEVRQNLLVLPLL
jgi:hypothetical protein